MIEVDWDDVYGWYSPALRALAPVSIHPGVSALHYAISAFEGLKAFRAADGRLLLFRPLDHARRLASSCARLTLPSFSAEDLVQLCKQLVRIDSRFVFPQKGLSLYLRPIVFSTYVRKKKNIGRDTSERERRRQGLDAPTRRDRTPRSRETEKKTSSDATVSERGLTDTEQ
ncbi:UNVERIFIED_CONTAM: hypothetical protein H355_008321 [Colinus virginianus]|nr:hypothetical protein H355_008321 [Colinus virginianus]